MADWSQLPHDIWISIAEKFTVAEDKIRFRSVCRTWRSLLPFPQPPWLMLAEDDDTPTSRGFFGLGAQHHHHQQVHQFELPEAHHIRCLGSAGTWLITIDYSERICLLNPFSRTQIDLPHQSTFEYGLAYDDDHSYEIKLLYRDSLIKKVVLSSSPLSPDCVAMAIHYHYYKIAMARPGDPSWTTVETPKDYFGDIIFYKSRFYGISRRGVLMVCEIDNSLHPPKATMLSEVSQNIKVDEVFYLVEWMGELLRVVKFMDKNRETYRLNRFEVCLFDFTYRKWKQLKDLGDYSLFLGFNTSIAILASQYPGVKRNRIYFTDDYRYGFVGLEIPGGRDMGVYHMEDGSVEPHYKGISTSLYSPPLWIIPSNPSITQSQSSPKASEVGWTRSGMDNMKMCFPYISFFVLFISVYLITLYNPIMSF